MFERASTRIFNTLLILFYELYENLDYLGSVGAPGHCWQIGWHSDVGHDGHHRLARVRVTWSTQPQLTVMLTRSRH